MQQHATEEKLGVGEVILSREEHTNWLTSVEQSALKTHTSNITWTSQVTFRNIYIYIKN